MAKMFTSVCCWFFPPLAFVGQNIIYLLNHECQLSRYETILAPPLLEFTAHDTFCGRDGDETIITA